MKQKRRKFSGAFKAKVAIEPLKERETLAAFFRRSHSHAGPFIGSGSTFG